MKSSKQTRLPRWCTYVALVAGAALCAFYQSARAETAEAQARATASDEGAIVDEASPERTTTVPVTPAISRRSAADDSVVAEPVRWRRGYYYGYARPYGGYYYGPRYYGYYRGPYYGDWGYRGYRGYYYGTPRVGYYDRPWGGGAVRVGPVWYGWR